MDISKNLIIMTVVVLVAIALVTIMSYNGSLFQKTPSDIDAFSKCLTTKGARMYGASWCSHCANQKLMFGESWKNVKYVECDSGSGVQTPECTKAGIQGYPTWDFSGQKVPGELTFEQLSQYSGCPLD